MATRSHALLLTLALFACGAPPPADTPAASSVKSAPEPEPERCLATMARARPSGWTDTGTIVVALMDGQPTAIEARDTSGKTIASKPAPRSGKEAQSLIAELTCKLGGLLAALDGPEPPKDGPATATLFVIKPAVSDEKIDVAILCKEPTDLPAEADESQKTALAFQMFQERLTTTRWRAWLKDLVDENRTTEGSPRVTMRKRRADELHEHAERAGITGPCWFESALRRAVQ